MTHRIFRGLTFLLFVSIFLMHGLAQGQARVEGQLSGTVVDQSGAVVPGATLTLNQPSTGFTTSITSNSSGAFVFPALPPGTYTVTVNAKGLAQTVLNDVVISTAHVTDVKVQMKVGATSETVEVSATSEVLETSSNTLSTTVTTALIQDLPLNGRDALPFAQLVPGAQVGGDQRFTTFDSMPNGAINISVDGTNDNFQRFRTSTTGFFTAAGLRIGAIDEMTVSTNDLTADAGAEGAVTIRVTTKRGTNEFHGNGFWETYNSAFNANSFQNDTYLYDAHQLCPSGFNSSGNCSDSANVDGGTASSYLSTGRKQPNHVNDYGGSVGGPILKNKLFFFVNYEYEKVPSTSLQFTNVLTTSGPACTNVSGGGSQNGCFTYTRADNGAQQTVNLYNVAAGAGFSSAPNQPIAGTQQTSLFSQISGFEKNGKLAPNTADTFLQTLQNTLSFPYDSSYKQTWPTARIDFLIKKNVTWHTSYNLYWRQFARTPIYPGDPVLENGFQSSYSTFSNGVDWTINSHLVNQANFGILNDQERFQPGNSFKAFQGITYLPAASSLSTGSSLFTAPVPDSGSILPEPRNNPVWNFADNLTWTHGNHSFTFGGDFRYSNQHDVGTQPPIAQNLGISSIDPAASMFNANAGSCTSETQGCFPGGLGITNSNEQSTDAQALYTLLVGRVSSISGSVPLDVPSKTYTSGAITSIKEKQKVAGFYFQDAWKVTPHLALNYGLRWQLTGPIINTDNYFTSPTYANLLGPSTALFQPGTLNGVLNPQISLRPQPYSGDYKQPAPNLGFAWNPDFESGILAKLTGNGKTVIRGGFAINWYDEGWIPWENVAAGSLSNEANFLSAGQFTAGSITFDPQNPQLNTLNQFPATGNQFVTPLPESGFTFTNSGAFSTVDPKIRPPYIENWQFGIQRQLPGNWVVELNYVGNHSVHMWEAYDLNEVNIFENGFLPQFKQAQANLALNNALPAADPYHGTFAYDSAVAGEASTPILTQAFGSINSSAWTNPVFLFDVQSGQAGTLAGAITQSPSYFCNLVANTFSPCVNQGYVLANQAPSPTAYPINIFQVNPYAGGNPLTLLSNPGSENYNGLQINVKHPVGHGLNFSANYALSHSFTNRYLGDYFSADSALVDFYTLRNPHLNRVPSPYDLRHTFHAYFTYELPVGRGKAFLRSSSPLLDKVIGGWSVGSVVSWQIGRNFKLAGGQNTYNYFDSFNFNNSSGFPPDPNDSGVALNGVTVSQLQSKVGVYPGPTITSTGGKTIPNPSTPTLVLPTSLFGTGGAVQPWSTPGTLGQNVFLHGPMLFNTDFSLTKHVPVWERVSLDIHAEFLNLFNHPNFNYTDGYSFGTNNPAQYLFVNLSPYAPGTVGQNGNRQIQFRAELRF